MLTQAELVQVLFPVGTLTKAEVRAHAAAIGLRTAGKPDSQDVCFITSTEGRDGFLGQRIAMHPARVIDGRNGEVVGSVEAVELVTVGQRRGMGHGADGQRRYVGAVDVPGRRVIVGGQSEAARQVVALVAGSVTWVDEAVAPGAAVLVQMSAHGRAVVGTVDEQGGQLVVRLAEPQRPVAPGQTVALYDRSHPDAVLGAGIAA
jgi:tRNA-specific 2-thiouridylase